ncbi:MAG: hypothetical protein ACPGYY_11150, partial [Bacteroidia bacterium]
FKSYKYRSQEISVRVFVIENERYSFYLEAIFNVLILISIIWSMYSIDYFNPVLNAFLIITISTVIAAVGDLFFQYRYHKNRISFEDDCIVEYSFVMQKMRTKDIRHIKLDGFSDYINFVDCNKRRIGLCLQGVSSDQRLFLKDFIEGLRTPVPIEFSENLIKCLELFETEGRH